MSLSRSFTLPVAATAVCLFATSAYASCTFTGKAVVCPPGVPDGSTVTSFDGHGDLFFTTPGGVSDSVNVPLDFMFDFLGGGGGGMGTSGKDQAALTFIPPAPPGSGGSTLPPSVAGAAYVDPSLVVRGKDLGGGWVVMGPVHITVSGENRGFDAIRIVNHSAKSTNEIILGQDGTTLETANFPGLDLYIQTNPDGSQRIRLTTYVKDPVTGREKSGDEWRVTVGPDGTVTGYNGGMGGPPDTATMSKLQQAPGGVPQGVLDALAAGPPAINAAIQQTLDSMPPEMPTTDVSNQASAAATSGLANPDIGAVLDSMLQTDAQAAPEPDVQSVSGDLGELRITF